MESNSFQSSPATSRQLSREGMTLIEVLVAMLILGTLLASAVTARSRYVQQAVKASHKQRAVAAADALLIQWSRDWASQGTSSSGPVSDDPAMSWRREILNRSDAENVGARVLRLEIYENAPASQPSINNDATLLTSVEVLISVEPKTNRNSPSSVISN